MGDAAIVMAAKFVRDFSAYGFQLENHAETNHEKWFESEKMAHSRHWLKFSGIAEMATFHAHFNIKTDFQCKFKERPSDRKKSLESMDLNFVTI